MLRGVQHGREEKRAWGPSCSPQELPIACFFVSVALITGLVHVMLLSLNTIGWIIYKEKKLSSYTSGSLKSNIKGLQLMRTFLLVGIIQSPKTGQRITYREV
jgi:hypothetical protein